MCSALSFAWLCLGLQVFSRVVSHGLDGRKLRATFKEADQLDYQDSLGQLLLATASTVPDGLLLFLPSYALMEKLSKRWQVRVHCMRGFCTHARRLVLCGTPAWHGGRS